MNAAPSGLRGELDSRTRYEVHRERHGGLKPTVDEYFGLDRARIAALSHALDGSNQMGERFTGTVTVERVLYFGDRIGRRETVDVIDERVASRLLNELRLPRPEQLRQSFDAVQGEADGLALP